MQTVRLIIGWVMVTLGVIAGAIPYAFFVVGFLILDGSKKRQVENDAVAEHIENMIDSAYRK